MMNVFTRVLARFFAQEIAQIIRRIAHGFGAAEYGGQALPSGPVGLEVLAEKRLEPGDDVLAGVASGNELARVEALAVAQQYLQLGHQELVAELVDVGVFRFDGTHDVGEGSL